MPRRSRVVVSGLCHHVTQRAIISRKFSRRERIIENMPMKSILRRHADIIFVDNESVFKSMVQKNGYETYFKDNFAGDFGHCTSEGNRLLAEQIAKIITRKIF